MHAHVQGMIFQCNEGHSGVEGCKGKLNEPKICPICRKALGSSRNRALEAVVSAVRMPVRTAHEAVSWWPLPRNSLATNRSANLGLQCPIPHPIGRVQVARRVFRGGKTHTRVSRRRLFSLYKMPQRSPRTTTKGNSVYFRGFSNARGSL